jgi:hypothetical protein
MQRQSVIIMMFIFFCGLRLLPDVRGGKVFALAAVAVVCCLVESESLPHLEIMCYWVPDCGHYKAIYI